MSITFLNQTGSPTLNLKVSSLAMLKWLQWVMGLLSLVLGRTCPHTEGSKAIVPIGFLGSAITFETISGCPGWQESQDTATEPVAVSTLLLGLIIPFLCPLPTTSSLRRHATLFWRTMDPQPALVLPPLLVPWLCLIVTPSNSTQARQLGLDLKSSYTVFQCLQ